MVVTEDECTMVAARWLRRVSDGPPAPAQPEHHGWLHMPAEASQVKTARDWAGNAMRLEGLATAEHIGDIVQIVSELVTNAIETAWEYAAARGVRWTPYDRPVGFRVLSRPRWSHLWVSDPDPGPIDRKPQDPMSVRGRGLTIVDAYKGPTGLRWPTAGAWGKTIQVVVPYMGVMLTADEQDQLIERTIR